MKFQAFFVTLMLTVCFSACSEYYYMPNRQNILPLKKKNDLLLTGAISGNEDGGTQNIEEVQCAYAVTNHIGVIANYFNLYAKSDSYHGHSNFTEIGAGYYSFEQEKSGPCFSIYGGGGYGDLSFNRNTNAKMSMYRLFLMPSFGYTSPYFDVIGSLRVCGTGYSHIYNSFVYDPNTNNNEYLNKPAPNVMYGFIEPALTIGGGSKSIKVHFQYVYSQLFNNRALDRMQNCMNVSLTFNVTGIVNYFHQPATAAAQ